jgi:iron-sulfur cluster assembly protein
MTTTQVQTETIQLTPTAAQMVRDLRAEHNLDESFALRIYVAGKSCSGYQYGMALDDKPQETDTSFENEGIKLLVDEISIQYMLGSTVDYINDERGKGFLVDNPNTAPACDCGGGGDGCGCETNAN